MDLDLFAKPTLDDIINDTAVYVHEPNPDEDQEEGSELQADET